MNDVPFVTWMTCSFNKINEQPGENKWCPKQTFHMLQEMAHAKEGSTKVSHSTVIALFAAKFLNNGPSGWIDVTHDSPKAIISHTCPLAQIPSHLS
jgi:hypothetical protein